MTAGDMSNRILERLDEIDPGSTAPSAVYYGAGGEVMAALNEAQRFFVLLTLCLETTAAFSTASVFQNMLGTFPDWLVPLRVSLPNGTRVRPARLAELDALDSGWQSANGVPARYGALGFDFFFLYGTQGTVNITYARAPVPMVLATDAPEIPEQHHPDLVDYGVYRLRAKEGGQEFAKGLVYFNRFLDGAQKYGEFVRARNIGTGYDTLPFELALFDRSRLVKLTAGGA